jgi:glycine/D-amino acid oxidase-like deaminating enzyme
MSSALPHALSIAHEAGLHPGKAYACLTQSLLQAGAHLHRGVALPPKSTWIQLSQGWEIPSSSGTWTADHVVVASNAWARECLPELDIVPGRGQVLLTAPIPNLPFQGTYHADAGYLYFRNVGNRLLLGGGRNQFRTQEETHSGDITPPVQDYLEAYLRGILLPGRAVHIEARWAGTMAFSSDGS